MKLFCSSLLTLFLPFAAFAQEDYLDTIAKNACNCIESQELLENYAGNELAMKMGLCLMTAAGDYREQLSTDHNIDLNRLDVEGEKLGALVGSRMAFICPESLVSAAGEMTDDEVTYYTETGTITAISEKPFVVFTIKNARGRTTDFYWLSFIESSLDLQQNFSELIGKTVNVEYLEEELFDPRIRDYRYFNHLTALEPAE